MSALLTFTCPDCDVILDVPSQHCARCGRHFPMDRKCPSCPPLSKAKLKEMQAELEAEDELHEKREPYLKSADDDDPTTRAARAVIAMAAGSHETLLKVEKPLTPRPDNLERDGSEFIEMSYALLEWIKCPVDARDFVIIMEGIARGNFSESFPMTDVQISALCGLTDRTIRDKRKALLEWQEFTSCVLVGIKEKNFNPEKGKNDPTEYHVAFIKPVAAFLRKARQIKAFQKNPARALEHADDPAVRALLDEFEGDLPIAEIVKRNQKEKEIKNAPKDDKMELAAKYLTSIKRAVLRWSDVNYLLGNDLPLIWVSLVDELSDTVLKAKERYEAKESKGRLKGKKTTRK